MSFLLDVKERGKPVALLSTTDLALAERFTKILTAAGFSVTAKHQPAAVEVNIKGEGGGAAN